MKGVGVPDEMHVVNYCMHVDRYPYSFYPQNREGCQQTLTFKQNRGARVCQNDSPTVDGKSAKKILVPWDLLGVPRNWAIT